MDIGEVATPPFAVLPNVANVFERRSERFAELAPDHQIEPYLNLLAQITRAQHDVQAMMPAPALPAAKQLELARENVMPPIST